MIIRADRIHSPLKKYIGKKNIKGTVHSIFEHAVNILVSEDHENINIISFVAKTPECFPWSVVLPVESMKNLKFSVGQDVFINKNGFNTSSIDIYLENEDIYDTTLPAFTENRCIAENINYIKTALHKISANESGSIPAIKSQALLEAKLIEAKTALGQNDCRGFRHPLTGIIGLGQGLTPSGDDYLTSLIALIKMPSSPLNKLDSVCSIIVAQAYGKTNILSYSYLKRASMGHVRGKLTAFIDAILTGSNLERALSDILTIGSSSGKDLASGVLYGFELIDILKNAEKSKQ